MRRQLTILGAALAMLAAIDLMVAALFAVFGHGGPLTGLERYFDYGRSVPGKIEAWAARPGGPGNLLDAAWLPEMIEDSAARFAAQPPGPVARTYGMSFVNRMTDAAQAIDPALRVDAHAGPAAPPNFVFAAFLDDRANRRRGDAVVLGILSSSVAGMGSFSNRTWVFEQPAPFTYPVFAPDASAGLTRTDPLIQSLADQRAALADPALAAAFRRQLADLDPRYAPAAFAAPWLDGSSFARLARRSRAGADEIRLAAAALAPDTGLPWAETLRRMIAEFARIARADGQVPAVMLIQTAGAGPDLAAALGPTLAAHKVAVIDSRTAADPRDPSRFMPDGHFAPDADAALARGFLGWLRAQDGW